MSGYGSTSVIYFTSGTVATSGELADIAALNSASVAKLMTQVQNGAHIVSGATNMDFAPDSGTILVGNIPQVYSGAYTSSTVSALTSTGGSVGPNEAVISSGATLTLAGASGWGASEIGIIANVVSGALSLPLSSFVLSGAVTSNVALTQDGESMGIVTPVQTDTGTVVGSGYLDVLSNDSSVDFFHLLPSTTVVSDGRVITGVTGSGSTATLSVDSSNGITIALS